MKNLHELGDPIATVDIAMELGAQALLATRYTAYSDAEFLHRGQGSKHVPGIRVEEFDVGPNSVTYFIQKEDPLPEGLTTDNILHGNVSSGIALLTSWGS